MTAEIRRARPGDEALWLVAADTVLSQARTSERARPEELAPALSDPRCLLYLALEGDEPIGLLSAYVFPDVTEGGRLAYLYDIEVLPSRRRGGLGARLVEALLEACAEQEVHTVWAGTERDNRAARRLFARTGADVVGDRYVEVEWELDDDEPE